MGTLATLQLRERGETKRMMERLLVKADGYAQNPHALTGRPMCLDLTDRVQEAESHDDFTGCLVAAKVRSARFADLYKLKADALSLIADGIGIKILELDRQTLTRNTHEEYGMFMRENDHHKNEVAYLLAHAKNSEWGLDAYYWHQGIRMARLKLLRRVLVKVIERYFAKGTRPIKQGNRSAAGLRVWRLSV